MRAPLPILAAAALAACVGPEDNPTNVHDLRVLGVSLESPEVMAPSCELTPQTLAVFSQPVQYTALIADPAGGGRALSWELWGCPKPSDRTCEDPNDRVLFGQGQTGEGELTMSLRPALAQIPDGTLLLLRVAQEDPYNGLGGIRMPLVLHLWSGSEEIWANKLMVYSCALFPDQAQNVTPVLPGIQLEGAELASGAELAGAGPFHFLPDDFSALQEPYVVPSLEFESADPTQLRPLHLEERWRIAWYADYGTFSSGQTGGADLSGESGSHRNEWRPPEPAEEHAVRFWFVVRDGRGGLSWLTRTATYRPQ